MKSVLCLRFLLKLLLVYRVWGDKVGEPTPGKFESPKASNQENTILNSIPNKQPDQSEKRLNIIWKPPTQNPYIPNIIERISVGINENGEEIITEWAEPNIKLVVLVATFGAAAVKELFLPHLQSANKGDPTKLKAEYIKGPILHILKIVKPEEGDDDRRMDNVHHFMYELEVHKHRKKYFVVHAKEMHTKEQSQRKLTAILGGLGTKKVAVRDWNWETYNSEKTNGGAFPVKSKIKKFLVSSMHGNYTYIDIPKALEAAVAAKAQLVGK